MIFPLTGKYSSGEVLKKNGKVYFKKIIKIPRHVNPERVLESIHAYRKQLEGHGIDTTKQYNSSVDKLAHTIVLTEQFYNKSLEIVIGTAPSKVAKKYFERLLDIVDRAYPDGKDPKVVVEIKPPNFLVYKKALLYCDFIPPRIYSKNIENIELEFYKSPSKSKMKKLKYRFLTKEGAYYYLLLHTISIRPSASSYFIKCTLAAIKDQALKERLEESLSSHNFLDDVQRFKEFYLARRNAYKKFICELSGTVVERVLFIHYIQGDA